MTSRLLNIVVLALVAAQAAQAAQILKVAASRKMMAITGVSPSGFSVNEPACIERNAANRVCGQVIKILPRGIIFSASTANHDFQAGETVTIRRGSRKVASQEYDNSSVYNNNRRSASSPFRHNDFTLGTEFIQPTLEYQRAFGNHFAIGLAPLYMSFSSLDGKLSGTGAHLTVNVYTKQPFKGWWFRAAVGYYTFTASSNATDTAPAVSESGSTLSFLGSIGYRWLFGRSGWNLGLGLGVQYLANPQTNSLQFSSILPNTNLNVGYAF